MNPGVTYEVHWHRPFWYFVIRDRFAEGVAVGWRRFENEAIAAAEKFIEGVKGQ